jgi:hypothetical protein
MHYDFATTFCNLAAGYETGNGENKVSVLRRNLLVSLRDVTDRVATNGERLTGSKRHWTRRHYKKGQPVQALFAVDREAMRVCPPPAFAPYRYTQVRTDRPGRFCLDRQQGYSSAPETAEQPLIVRVGAHTVEPLAPAGRPWTGHPPGVGTRAVRFYRLPHHGAPSIAKPGGLAP